ncbi:hypothetical protein [Hyalangium rubrum]|uniref:Uncharacterized protein n=1 Tax=Hyalangium rubrum TaxID=3103134 RepID=A0ABU5HHM4_9BACT|nr:hypothetical protein [Hyalangium sp. s54d21]MDY7232755.1 hypothetical protein [Hyalangium sp. s54d21]
MSDFTREELIRVAHHYYPVGFPVETDTPEQPLHPYQRTAEYGRWLAAWEQALAWKDWDSLLDAVHEAFPGDEAGDVTQPRMAACLRCCLYRKESQADGGQRVTRVVAAVSVLAPVYRVYVTTQAIWFRQRSTPAQLFLEPPSEVRPLAGTLALLIERVLGYRPFPLPLAEVALPELRVGYLKRAQPTLLTALLSDRLENLP